jgi:hypothetical protein
MRSPARFAFFFGVYGEHAESGENCTLVSILRRINIYSNQHNPLELLESSHWQFFIWSRLIGKKRPNSAIRLRVDTTAAYWGCAVIHLQSSRQVIGHGLSSDQATIWLKWQLSDLE